MSAATDFWQEYDQWNQALTDYFLSGDASGRPVYLGVEDDLLVSLGSQLGFDDPVTLWGANITSVSEWVTQPATRTRGVDLWGAKTSSVSGEC